jgi:hypothetical protein
LKKILDSFIDRLHKKLIDVESKSNVQSNSSDQSEQQQQSDQQQHQQNQTSIIHRKKDVRDRKET